MRIWLIAPFCFFSLLAAGCNTALPTGYEPVKLGTLTPTERRGLYAEDYSLEARAAQEDQHKNNNDISTKSPGQP